MTPERLAEIRRHTEKCVGGFECDDQHGQSHADHAHDLLAEVDRLTAERDQFAAEASQHMATRVHADALLDKALGPDRGAQGFLGDLTRLVAERDQAIAAELRRMAAAWNDLHKHHVAQIRAGEYPLMPTAYGVRDWLLDRAAELDPDEGSDRG